MADAVTLSGGPIIQRIRLQEEAENQITGQSMMMDDDLLQYYHFLADKGDVQAQVVLGQLYFQGGRGVSINHEVSWRAFSFDDDLGTNTLLADYFILWIHMTRPHIQIKAFVLNN